MMLQYIFPDCISVPCQWPAFNWFVPINSNAKFMQTLKIPRILQHLYTFLFCVSTCKLSSTVLLSARIGVSLIGRLECDIIPMFESQLPRTMERTYRWSQGRGFKEFISCSFQKHKPLECVKNQKTKNPQDSCENVSCARQGQRY